MDEPFKILFVCLGNICRSPIAHGYFEQLLADNGLAGQVKVDSAGTSAFHRGEAPDPGSRRICRDNGISIDHQKSRKITSKDLYDYDLIVAMDNMNHRDLQSMASGQEELLRKIVKMRDYDADSRGGDVPDPYGGGLGGFREVYDIIARSSQDLLNDVKERLS